MSAIVCGKRSFFEDIPTSPTSSSPPRSKKIRCSSSTSPVRFSISPHSPSPLVDQLRLVFPNMDKHLLEKALGESGNDLDSAIKSLHELYLGYEDANSGFAIESRENIQKGADESAASLENLAGHDNLHINGSEWVEFFVREMTNATSIDDARSRAMRLLESLERTVSKHAGAAAAKSFLKENLILKEQIEILLRENVILKKAVAIQHERQKEYDERSQELQHLKQLVSQYQEQLRTLEVNNYALAMHLRQAQGGNSIPGRFNPDVF